MKKHLIPFIVFISFMILLQGCQKQGTSDCTSKTNYTVPTPSFVAESQAVLSSFLSEHPNIDGFSFDDLNLENDLYNQEQSASLEVPSTAEIEIDGILYSGSITLNSDNTPKQFYMHYNNYPIFCYQDKIHSSIIGFDSAGNLAYYVNSKKNYESSGKLTLEECTEIANGFFSSYVPYVDSNNYMMSYSAYFFASDVELREFTFTKQVDGVMTTDYATITLTESGSVFSFASSCLGRVNLTNTPFDIDRVKTAIDSKFQSALIGKEHLFSFADYEIRDLRLTILKNGTPALIVTVLPTLIEAIDGFQWKYSDLITFVIQTAKQ